MIDLQYLKRNLIQIPGWRTNRKIVVIESDDWGSIRMASNNSYNLLLKAGIPVHKDPYCKFDSLESKNDLEALFDILKKFKDKYDNHPIITANTIVANPDFEKIAASNFESYHHEIFTKTLERYHGDGKTFQIWKQGIEENVFRPQFHGREHVNVEMWMNSLRNDDDNIRVAFKHQIFGIPTSNLTNKRGNYMASFDFENEAQLIEIKKTISEGLNIFNDIFGYYSKTIIAPCYVWSNELDLFLKNHGIMGFQGISYQYIPILGKQSYKKKIHYTGQTNAIEQRYLVRNAFFEPTHFKNKDEVKEIITRMNTAFFWKKPFIIGSHRINFMGTLDPRNRKENLQKLEIVLKAIIKEHPDVEFMSSDMVIELMLKEHDTI